MSSSLGNLQIDFCNAFNSIKKQGNAVASSMPFLPIFVIHNTANCSMTNLLLAMKAVSKKATHIELFAFLSDALAH